MEVNIDAGKYIDQYRLEGWMTDETTYMCLAFGDFTKMNVHRINIKHEMLLSLIATYSRQTKY